ncbi:MAG: hypothetical protein MRERC_2c010 [Mycoplasmataceae bacterium RC_NB112A]|nr:MAG: hypothetical protein MRERC_6c090 [Mycoplasmataceae bacterium RC_NB112A]KLL02139.1 MAG: hypothetical protein MRERC_4c099 [Mycoplasmataceae bacterium RC_NB112A]KLL02170.1 MAG: hypothetical protein MRERC_4c144 [Mycoplasmataceae bacterium RC_NB112A]KLL02300.1 MAG: hypothetical protein MRERC_2c010 [Mycoplasmataceae bacterium RC_NB112A]
MALGGRPGVGKTQIVKTMSQALMRNSEILGVASQDHPKILEGIGASYKGAEIGGVMKCFVDPENKPSIKILKRVLQEELDTLKAHKNVAAGRPLLNDKKS